MTRRKLAFLLIGLGAIGIGTMLAVVIIVVSIWAHHTFTMNPHPWQPASILFVLPFLMIAVGAMLLLRKT